LTRLIGIEMAKSIIEDWAQTLGASIVAAALPLVLGKTVQLFSPAIMRMFSAEPIANPHAIARTAGSYAALVSSFPVVFLFARWAARGTSGSPLARAMIVGLTPGVFYLAFLAWRLPSAFTRGEPVRWWALLIWVVLLLGCGVLAGAFAARRTRSIA
jgi:hypothetical protein